MGSTQELTNQVHHLGSAINEAMDKTKEFTER